MRIVHPSHSLCALFLSLCLAIWLAPTLSWGADEDDTLALFNASQEQLVSVSRFPRPVSQIAENVTVITAADIARLNAHTLSDVLQTMPGIQLDYLRTPSSVTFFNIQGALNTTVLVLIDGIRQNDFQQNIAMPGMIPVQQIERIEIIKGAASAAWGSALGGVINIITKSPNPDRSVSGVVSGSIGSQFTADTRAELSGTVKQFGYYLTAGNLRSDGFFPNTATNMNNLYGKISYLLPGNGTATIGLSHLNARPGLDEGIFPGFGLVHDNTEFRRNNGFLKYSQPLGDKFTLDIDGYFTNRDDHTRFGGPDGLGGFVFSNDFNSWDNTRGVNSRFTWRESQYSLMAGVDYANAHAIGRDQLNPGPPDYDLSWDSWALYGNGSYSIGKLTVLPGIRYDITGLVGDNLSYTLGATYQLTESTLLRSYAAQGYSLPHPLLRKSGLQKIKTVQGGIESGAVPYLWLKGTYFFNALRNSQSVGAVASITNQNRQGFEIEARTTPFFDFYLTSGYTYLFAKNVDTGERLKTDSSQTVPPHVVKLALNYNKSDLGLSGALTGNYVWWGSPDTQPSRSTGMIWDLHLNWKVLPKSELSPELFFSGRNLFNGGQTTDTFYINAPRWFEGGMRVRF